jgi:hypothetical protein
MIRERILSEKYPSPGKAGISPALMLGNGFLKFSKKSVRRFKTSF